MVQNSLGSGVIVSNEGHIITNNHVVDQVDEIEVQLSDGRTKKARLVGADAQVDLAVLKVDEPGLKPLKFGDSDRCRRAILCSPSEIRLDSRKRLRTASSAQKDDRIALMVSAIFCKPMLRLIPETAADR